MKELLILTGGAGAIIVPCPPTKRVRLVSVLAALSAPNEGDQILLGISRSTNLVAQIATEQVTASAVFASFTLGGHTTAPREDIVNVATGVVTYNQSFTDADATLPQIWWPFEITVTVTQTATITVLYEMEDNR